MYTYVISPDSVAPFFVLQSRSSKYLQNCRRINRRIYRIAEYAISCFVPQNRSSKYVQNCRRVSCRIVTHVLLSQAMFDKIRILQRTPFGDHPFKFERCKEDQHGPWARMTRTTREV